MPKTTEDTKSYYVPFQRFEEVTFEEDGQEDEVAFTATLRTNLTFAEVDALVWEADTNVRETLWPMFAPYVTGWNLRAVADNGDLVEIDPPSVGGPEQFQYVPVPLFWAIAREVKIRNVGKIDPKRKSRPVSMGVTDGGES